MKRFIAVLLCAAMMCSLLIVPALAENDRQNEKISLLTNLGMISKYESGADVTRETMINFLDILYGENAHTSYLENRDLKSPILYGQVLMILVDITGYSAYLDIYSLDKNNIESYFDIAVKAGMTNKKTGSFTEAMHMEDYAELIYQTLTEVNLLTYSYGSYGNASYSVDQDRTLLSSVLKLTRRDGVVTGTSAISLEGDRAKGRIAVNGVWYNWVTDEDLLQYVGMPVRIYFNEESDEIYSLVSRKNKVDIIEVESDDIVSSDTDISKITYWTKNKRKTMSIDKEADFVLNRCLLEAYTDNDLTLPDCSYRFIDNNNDANIDVIIADKYDVFMADTVIEDDSRIVDTNSRIYDLEEYFDNDYEIYDDAGHIIMLDDISENNIVSYQKSRTGEYTNFVVSSKRVSGKIESMSDEWKYIFVTGIQYQCLESYYNYRDDFEEIKVGDEVELFLDFKGRVADIKLVNSPIKAGYIFSGYCGDFEQVIKLLQEDGKIETIELANKVTVDGTRRSADELSAYTPLFDNGKAIPQLIQYKQSTDGKITMIDTAEDTSGIGSNDNSGFTLDYDYEKANTLRAITLNGKTVLGSKYLPDSNTKVFGVNTKEKYMSYVQSGTAIPTQSSLKVKMFNVGKDYSPQYIVIDATTTTGAWVDVWEETYVVDNIHEIYDEEIGEICYELEYFDGSGNSLSSIVRDGTLISPNGNAMSGDSRFRKVQIKDVPRGTVIQFNENNTGITSYSIQAMPMKDNSEIIFEKCSTIGGNDYGVDEYMFNGSSLCSYGKVIKRLPEGIVINNHLPTDVEASKGGVFPMESWNRTIPLAASDFVWFYDKDRNRLEKGNASEILEGDMIFMHRRAGTIMMTIVYR